MKINLKIMKNNEFWKVNKKKSKYRGSKIEVKKIRNCIPKIFCSQLFYVLKNIINWIHSYKNKYKYSDAI